MPTTVPLVRGMAERLDLPDDLVGCRSGWCGEEGEVMNSSAPLPLHIGSPFAGRFVAEPLHGMDPDVGHAQGRLDSRARNALVLGICAFVPIVGVILAIGAIGVGHGALRHIEASSGGAKGVGVARTGIVLGWLSLATFVLTIVALPG